MPRVGDRVICQMKPAEGFGTQTPYKYYGFDVRSVQTPTDTRRPRNKLIDVIFLLKFFFNFSTSNRRPTTNVT